MNVVRGQEHDIFIQSQNNLGIVLGVCPDDMMTCS